MSNQFFQDSYTLSDYTMHEVDEKKERKKEEERHARI